MNTPNYCPKCEDYDFPGEPLKLKLSFDKKVLFCAGVDDENPCGFHYDLKENRRFHYEPRCCQAFWAIIAILTLFRFNFCFKKVWDHEVLR